MKQIIFNRLANGDVTSDAILEQKINALSDTKIEGVLTLIDAAASDGLIYDYLNRKDIN